MNRFLAHPRLAVLLGGWLRCTGGVLGCTAMAGAISIGAAPPSDAAAQNEPEPRRSQSPTCRQAMSVGDWYTAHKCKEAWRSMYERSRRRSGRDREFSRRPHRHTWNSEIEHGRSSPVPSEEHSPRPALPDPASAEPPSPPRKSTFRPTPSTPKPTPTRDQSAEAESRPPTLQPVLLLSLLIPAAAAICYPFRHRLYAVATAGTAALPVPDEEDEAPAGFGYRPVLDPFALRATGLSGSGAVSTARVLALTALDEHGDDSLVVVPRPDATVLFGLAEDELLDDDTDGLFIPGNLDAALAYLETELAIRENTGVTQARRLLLVADCTQEADRIHALLARHPGGVSAILLGPWSGDTATIDDNGLVDAPPGLASGLPDRVPALSRVEARDRLLAALARHRETKKPSRRRSSPRRP
jgi:hypothetical protein